MPKCLLVGLGFGSRFRAWMPVGCAVILAASVLILVFCWMFQNASSFQKAATTESSQNRSAALWTQSDNSLGQVDKLQKFSFLLLVWADSWYVSGRVRTVRWQLLCSCHCLAFLHSLIYYIGHNTTSTACKDWRTDGHYSPGRIAGPLQAANSIEQIFVGNL